LLLLLSSSLRNNYRTIEAVNKMKKGYNTITSEEGETDSLKGLCPGDTNAEILATGSSPDTKKQKGRYFIFGLAVAFVAGFLVCALLVGALSNTETSTGGNSNESEEGPHSMAAQLTHSKEIESENCNDYWPANPCDAWKCWDRKEAMLYNAEMAFTEVALCGRDDDDPKQKSEACKTVKAAYGKANKANLDLYYTSRDLLCGGH